VKNDYGTERGGLGPEWAGIATQHKTFYEEYGKYHKRCTKLINCISKPNDPVRDYFKVKVVDVSIGKAL
jgi:hypothetical protein